MNNFYRLHIYKGIEKISTTVFENGKDAFELYRGFISIPSLKKQHYTFALLKVYAKKFNQPFCEARMVCTVGTRAGNHRPLIETTYGY